MQFRVAIFPNKKRYVQAAAAAHVVTSVDGRKGLRLTSTREEGKSKFSLQ
jgi:hypothetical protein